MQLQHTCDQLKDEHEIAILERYNYIGRWYSVAIMSKTVAGFHTSN